jgi:serine phosphatase RsbU (regulator of sigma subunit)
MNQLMDFFKKFQNSLKSNVIYCSIIFLFCFNNKSFAQNQHEIDSLEKVLPTIKVDSLKLQTLNILTAEIVDIDPTKSIGYANEALVLAEKLNKKKSIALALHNMGNGHFNLAEYKTAISFYIKALNIQEAIGNKKGILASSGAIGNVFLDLKQPDEAYKYLSRALEISKETNNKGGMATCLIAIGTVFSEKKDYKQSLEYTFKSMKLFEELDVQEAVATCLNNIADSYLKLNEPDKSMFYINKAYGIYVESGNIYGMSLALNNLGDFYESQGNFGKAIEHYTKGLEYGKQIGANDRIIASYKGLYLTNKKMGNFKEALAINELYQQINDSIYNTESSKQIAEMQTRFDTEKKAKEIDILTKDKKIREDELIQQRFISWSVTIGGGLVFLLALVAIRGYIQKRKVSNQLAIKNEKIENAYSIIENQHKDIKDSIRYAKRLQEAILPTTAFQNIFHDNAFVLYKPKDIVSGDFYWIEEIETNNSKQLLFAAVDCTGHGVPGAFMSIVGHNLLNQAVKEHNKTKPSDILDEVNVSLNETLRQTLEESTVKDGMDIALCSLQKNNSNSFIFQYAGANNPVWIVRAKETQELEEIKGDKFPIGVFLGEELNKFKNHEIELFSGDTIYIFTDGFADQFGGPKGKKFMYKPFKQFILSIQHLTMKEQSEALSKVLTDWKGDLEQIDDVLVVGIKV